MGTCECKEQANAPFETVSKVGSVEDSALKDTAGVSEVAVLAGAQPRSPSRDKSEMRSTSKSTWTSNPIRQSRNPSKTSTVRAPSKASTFSGSTHASSETSVRSGESITGVSRRQFIVRIVGARCLRDASWMQSHDKSHCYCTLEVGQKTLHTTRTINDMPVLYWNEEALVDVFMDEPIQFSIWYQNVGQLPSLVGTASLASELFYHDGFNGEVPLVEEDLGLEPFLKLKVKRPCHEFPKEPPSEAIVKIKRDKKEHGELGLDIDTSDNVTAYVTGVRAGPFERNNKKAKPEDQLRLGDFIIAVNGKTGSSMEILKEMKKGDLLTMVVKRPLIMNINVRKYKSSEKWGLGFPDVPLGNTLLITKVQPGPVMEWNDKNPQQSINFGDRIVAVGGKTGTGKMLKKWFNDGSQFQLTLVRAAGKESGWWFWE